MSREDIESKVSGWSDATCIDCGLPFGQDKHWRRRCPVCFKVSKSYKILAGDEQVLYLQQRMKTLLDAPPKVKRVRVNGEGTLTKKELTRLIVLCHPDKHQNSQLAEEMTKLLLSLREKV